MIPLKKQCWRYLLLGLVIMTLINISTSCSKSEGKECDRCESDSECNEGLTCEIFTDFLSRCAGSGSECTGINWKQTANNENEIITVTVKDEVDLGKRKHTDNGSITGPY